MTASESLLLWPDVASAVARLLLAALLGGLIGLERELKQKSAGLRTHALITMSSAAFTLFALELSADAQGDPQRVIQGIIMGVGFIGGGAIVRTRDGEEAKGVTTASSVWTATAVGIACGAGWFVIAVVTALLTLAITWGLFLIERRYWKS
jgi:putative Mg2+ transporter-C (MgtC) family protein